MSPKTDIISEQRKRQLAILIEQRKTSFSSVCVGIFVILFTLGAASSLIVLGIIKSNKDILIAGGVFGVGGIVFLILCIIGRCRPYIKNRQVRSTYIKEIKDMK